jgi:hypothetical protein
MKKVVVMPEDFVCIYSYSDSPAHKAWVYGDRTQYPTFLDTILFLLPHEKRIAEDGELWHCLNSGWVRDYWFVV